MLQCLQVIELYKEGKIVDVKASYTGYMLEMLKASPITLATKDGTYKKRLATRLASHITSSTRTCKSWGIGLSFASMSSTLSTRHSSCFSRSQRSASAILGKDN